MKGRTLLWIGLLCLVALATGSALADDASVPASGGMGLDYVLSLGPYGALVWGAYTLGRGVKLSVQIELSEQDRDLLSRLAEKRAP